MERAEHILEKEEVLRYLGYRGSEILPHTERLIEQCIQKTAMIIRPLYLYRRYSLKEVSEGLLLEGTGLILPGQDIKNHLSGCQDAYLLCATVGSLLDKNIRLQMVKEPAAGVVLDACGSVAIEQVVDMAEREIEKEVALEGRHITWRFSPGYGDLPLNLQHGIVEVLDVYRKMGVSVSEDMLLTPSKSVTAIVGVMGQEKTDYQGKEKCECCLNRERCNFYNK